MSEKSTERALELPHVHIPKFGVKRIDPPKELAELNALAPAISQLGHDTVEFMEAHPMLGRVGFKIQGTGGTDGVVIFERADRSNAPIDFYAEGELGRNVPKVPKGEGFAALEAGTVYFQSSEKRPPYAKSGQIVRKGDPVLWLMVDKSNQGPIEAPITGKIRYVVENDTKVVIEDTIIAEDGSEIKQEATVLFYIDPNDLTPDS